MLGPLICGWLAQALGWGYGFGAAGIAMLAGLALYLGMPHAAEPVGLAGAMVGLFYSS